MRMLLSLFVLLSCSLGFAETSLRWTYREDSKSDLASVIARINGETSYGLVESDFLLLEDRELATSHFRMYAQVAEGLPVEGLLIRIWAKVGKGELIQAEAVVESKEKHREMVSELRSKGVLVKSLIGSQADMWSLKLARKAVTQHPDDSTFSSYSYRDQWQGSEPVRVVTVKGRRGKHKIVLSLFGRKVLSHTYKEFPQRDQRADADAELTIQVPVFPIYEEVEGTGEILERVNSELKYIKTTLARPEKDPYEVLRAKRYFEDFYNPALAETEEGRAQGYWSMALIKRQAEEIRQGLTPVANDFGSGLVLEGRYATINLHPGVVKSFGDKLDFKPAFSTHLRPDWVLSERDSQVLYEMIPQSTLLGKPIASAEEAAARPARRLADHDPVSYINDGFDELQVYYGTNVLMEKLQERGFTDPELSVRPFHAFLYDPDIGMRDNAYYTDDTINFTTYSSTAQNMARDNPTIWHELGHGIMDRMMGDYLNLADTGGLSEGMADFVAALVTESVTGGGDFPGYSNFRIVNQTGFFLTNEVHDDGEAYGGAMYDFLLLAMAREGHDQGLHQVTDLTLEAMRLSRNHPELTAQEWFAHMLFADEIGREGVRAPGALSDLILKALAGRNFSLDESPAAAMTVMNGAEELTSESLGSRENPIRLSLKKEEDARYELKVNVKNSDTYSFKFPVTVKVEYQKGALQGAVRWEGEGDGADTYTLASEADTVTLPLVAKGECEYVNQEDGSCKDYAYIQILNDGETKKPSAKKRFYLRIKTQ